MEASLVGQGEVPIRAPEVRGERQPRGILHPWIGNVLSTKFEQNRILQTILPSHSHLPGVVLQPEEKGARAPAPPPRHGARARRGGLHDRDDHVAPIGIAWRHRAGAGTPGLALCACVEQPQDEAQGRLRAQRCRVGHAKADDASVEDGRAADALPESVVRQGGDGDGGGLGRRRGRRQEVLQPDV